jgi:hypothetical protein
MRRNAIIPIKGTSPIQFELGRNKSPTRKIRDIREVIDIVIAWKRSRFSDALLIHLYSKKIRQQKEKITIKRTNVLNKKEDSILIASSDAVTTIINITERSRALAESIANCNILIPLDLIFERLRINAKRNGTDMIFMDERIMFSVVKI